MDEVSELRKLLERKVERLYTHIDAAKAESIEHARRNREQGFEEVGRRIDELRFAVHGDGNGRVGLVRRLDDMSRRLELLETLPGRVAEVEGAVASVPQKLDDLSRAVANVSYPPPSSTRTKLGISPQAQHTLIVAVSTAILSLLGVTGGQQLLHPGTAAQRAQAEALAEKQAALEQRERWLRWREQRRHEAPK